MARMPGTDWIGPTPNRRIGGMSEHRGLVLHIQDGTEDGSEAWFKNPDSQASAHFLNPKSGNLRQLVDTDDRAWTEAAGNAYWVSVENEGRGGDALTPSQIENCARLLAWLHQTYGAPIQATDDPNGAGLGWHGMGGAAWGGHYDCPGKPVLAQRGQILARAQQLTNPTPSEEDDMPYSEADLTRIIGAAVTSPGVRDTLSWTDMYWWHATLTGRIPDGAPQAQQQMIPPLRAAFLAAVDEAVQAQLGPAVKAAVAEALASGVQLDVTATAATAKS